LFRPVQPFAGWKKSPSLSGCTSYQVGVAYRLGNCLSRSGLSTYGCS
jgi:hypothetical protein